MALQSIHGQQEDFDVSFNQGGKANAVIRASSMLVELAVAESPASGGKAVGYFDFDELQAHAALLFKNADTIPAIEGGWTEATIKIAPTGDVLLDRSFEEQSLQKRLKFGIKPSVTRSPNCRKMPAVRQAAFPILEKRSMWP